MVSLNKKVFVIRTNIDNKMHAVKAPTSMHALQFLTYKESNYYKKEMQLMR